MGKHIGVVEIIENCVSEQQCDNIVNQLKQLNPAYWTDRSIHAPNFGIDGSVGTYVSLNDKTCPPDLLTEINSVAPKITGHAAPMEIDETIVNHYSPGSFVPPHIDAVTFTFAIAVVTLESKEECFAYWPDGHKETKVVIPDKKGAAIILHDVRTVHEVMPTEGDRYTLIYNYY
jgi:hypothetical protein